ncbi:MAG: endo-1,4-beta-xylanase, partial [Proteobacteria bacterium]|nr:endo-1,4-beta-xylanase [Pseudomonadota bacterium]
AYLVPALVSALTLAPPVPAQNGLDCAAEGADCTLREAALQAGLYVGAAEGPLGTDAAFNAALARHFDSITTENALKWGPLTSGPGAYDFARADEAVAFAEANGMRVRGHTLFWSRLNGLPGWLEDDLAAAADPAERLRERMSEHVNTVVGRYRGRIDTWDVVNEPLSLGSASLDLGNLYFQTLGVDYIADAFHLARAADPDALLFLNEVLPSLSQPTFDGLLALVTDLLDQGVPIDGVGFQAHYFLALPDPAVLQERLRAFADLGLIVELTELDVSLGLLGAESDPLAAQADAYADIFAACLAVDACVGITVWGVDDGHTWLDSFIPPGPHRPLLLDESYQPKPAYRAARDVVALPEPGAAARALGVLLGLKAVAGVRSSRRRVRRGCRRHRSDGC